MEVEGVVALGLVAVVVVVVEGGVDGLLKSNCLRL
jgi:hypothetical protein